MSLRIHCCEGTSQNMTILQFLGHPSGGLGLDDIVSPSLLPVLLWFLSLVGEVLFW